MGKRRYVCPFTRLECPGTEGSPFVEAKCMLYGTFELEDGTEQGSCAFEALPIIAETLQRMYVEDREDMEKYGVTTPDPPDKTASSRKRCPKCGAELELHGNVVKCPACGTEPFEGKHGEEGQ